MSRLFRLTERHMERIRHLFPKPRGRSRGDGLKILSGLIHVNRNGLRRYDAPPEYGSYKTLYNRWKRWSEKGVFLRIFQALAGAGGDANNTPMIDATHLKTHRMALSLNLGKRKRHIGRTKGGLNSKLHVMTDAFGRLVRMIPTAGRVSDCTGAWTLVNDLPDDAERLAADRGYDANRFCKALKEKKIVPCIPPRCNRVEPVGRDPELYRRRHLVENLFDRPGTGGGSRCAMTGVPRSSCRLAFLQRPSCSGYEV